MSSKSYTFLDIPGFGVATSLSANTVVGYSRDGSGLGFLYDTSSLSYTTFGVPGSTSTYPFGVSGNTVVGYDYHGTGWHGFLYDTSSMSYTTLDAPRPFRLKLWAFPATTSLGIIGTAAEYTVFYNDTSSQDLLDP